MSGFANLKAQIALLLDARAAEVLRVVDWLLRLPRYAQDLHQAQMDMLTTSRFNRGVGSIGPLLNDGEGVDVGQTPMVLHNGGEFPVGITIEVPATGRATDYLYVNRSAGSIKHGPRWPTQHGVSLAQGNPAYIVADRHQQLFVGADIYEDTGGGTVPTGTVRIRVYKSRL